MEQGIERLTAFVLVITGLSHIVAPKVWVRFFMRMREQGEIAGFLNAYVHIPLGLLIVAFHHVWTWPGIVVTLLGWSLTLKGTLYFLWPGLALKTMAGVSEEKAWHFRVAGILAILLGLVVGWIALRAAPV